MAENIDAKDNWRSLVLAFVIWAVHFIAVYGAALLLPENPTVRWIAIAATLLALVFLARWWLRHGRSVFASLAITIAGAAVTAQTFPAVIG